MNDVSLNLKIKYGLENEPSDDLIRRWARRSDELIRLGMTNEDAGRKAAAEIFPNYERYKYASMADSIEALLMQARNK